MGLTVKSRLFDWAAFFARWYHLRHELEVRHINEQGRNVSARRTITSDSAHFSPTCSMNTVGHSDGSIRHTSDASEMKLVALKNTGTSVLRN